MIFNSYNDKNNLTVVLLFLQLKFMRDNDERILSNCTHKYVQTNCKKCGVYNH
jgi:hypothetical protein